jgi:D-alanyl-lipoteichoic acid acyltransferase DltB (MBOAT superfamily)
VIWGGLHGLYQIVGQLWNRAFPPREAVERTWWKHAWDVATTFALVTFAWIFFRAHGAQDAFRVVDKLFVHPSYGRPDLALNGAETALCVALIGFLLYKEHYHPTVSTASTWKFAGLMGAAAASCYLLGVFDHAQFIYFQF